jgi:hypothetical protein
MKAADIPDKLILEYLSDHQGCWSCLFGISFYPSDREVDRSLPFDQQGEIIVAPETPEKVMLAKMRSLYRRGLAGGCPCGCRGDWEITDKGLAFIGKARTKAYTGY